MGDAAHLFHMQQNSIYNLPINDHASNFAYLPSAVLSNNEWNTPGVPASRLQNFCRQRTYKLRISMDKILVMLIKDGFSVTV